MSSSFTEGVRSLSADELDSARETQSGRLLNRHFQPQREADVLLRNNHNNSHNVIHHHHYQEPSVPMSKPRGGLLKRLRNVFRANASSARSTRVDKSARATVDILPEEALPSSLGNSQNIPNSHRLRRAHFNHQHNTPRYEQPQDVPEARPPAHYASQRHAQPEQQQPRAPLGKAKTAYPQSPSASSSGRSRSWRPSSLTSSARNLAVERQPSDLGEAPLSKGNRFRGASNDNSKRNHSLNGPAAATRSQQPLPQRQSNPLSQPAPPTAPNANPPSRHGSHRSLPKRVFSSPPSLSARSFVFGSRKRSSTASKSSRRSTSALGSNSNYGGSATPPDTDNARKLSRSFGGRPGVVAFNNRGSMNLSVGNSLSPHNTYISPENNAASFKIVVEGAVDGKVSFSALLDAMFRLEERLPQDVKDILIKYLSREDNIEALIDRLTVILPIVADDDGVEGPSGERVRYRHSYVSSMLLSNGPMQLRRCLFSNASHLDRLVGVLQYSSPSDPVLVRSVCKVLLSVLRDSPTDTVGAMTRRRDFLNVLLSHIAVTGCPEVCLAMLSQVRCQQELKFGPANKRVVSMMADGKLLPTLCDRLAAAAEKGPLTSVASATIENCSRVIVGIALRALVISRFDVDDEDEGDAVFMEKFNRDLSSLDVFNQPTPILRVLDSGFAAMAAHDERGYALATALTAVRYMLVTVINGQDSSLSTIRIQLNTLSTTAYEAGVRARIPKLAKVLRGARAGVRVETMWDSVDGPLGVVRLKILELLAVLLQHGTEKTAEEIVRADIPRILFNLFERLKLNSLLQHMVATIVDYSFSSAYPHMRRAFLLDVRLLEVSMRLWKVNTKRSRCEGVTHSNCCSDIARMARAADNFLRDKGSAEVQEIIAKLGDQYDKFVLFCDEEIVSYEGMNGQLLGGAPLPRRADDGYPSMDGLSLGGMPGPWFVRPRATGTVGYT